MCIAAGVALAGLDVVLEHQAFLGEALEGRFVDARLGGHENTRSSLKRGRPIQEQLGADAHREADGPRHASVLAVAKREQSRELLAVVEGVLHHAEVALTLAQGQLLLKERGEGLQGRPGLELGGEDVTREQPLHGVSGRAAASRVGLTEARQSVLEDEVLLGHTRAEHARHDVRESLVTECAAKARLGLGDVVGVSVLDRVTVRELLQGQTRELVHAEGLSRLEQGGAAADRHALAVLEEKRVVLHGVDHADRGPAELVAKWVVGRLGGDKATAHGLEGGHVAALAVDAVDDLLGTHVVHARVKAHLAKNGHSALAGSRVELLHGRAHVARGHEWRPVLDAQLCDLVVHGGREERDHRVAAGHQLGKFLAVLDRVEERRLDVAAADRVGQTLRLAGHGAAHHDIARSVAREQLHARPSDHAGAKHSHGLERGPAHSALQIGRCRGGLLRRSSGRAVLLLQRCAEVTLAKGLGHLLHFSLRLRVLEQCANVRKHLLHLRAALVHGNLEQERGLAVRAHEALEDMEPAILLFHHVKRGVDQASVEQVALDADHRGALQLKLGELLVRR
mmetsp:Transcript_5023/g.14322  ORF Transcript_5023/g.14322 Transcript_5023/m.14322 type:complete len:567 (+) Transcript_5023:354-2054(+)